MPHTGTLEVTTPGECEIVMRRVFHAPRALVFKALTTPELLQRWLLGPDGWELVVCRIDLRVGGTYRHVWRHADGRELAMGGSYREIVVPARIVSTELFDQDWTGGETLNTCVLDEAGGRTTLVNTVRYSSRQARDGALKSGMARGVTASYNRLQRVLDTLAGPTA